MKKQCQEVKCSLNISCKSGESLQYVNSSCCPSCVCDKCPPLNYKICSYGFKPIIQNRTLGECCDSLTCISDPNHNEDLTLSIRESSDDNTVYQHRYHTFEPTIGLPSGRSIYKTIIPADSFIPSQLDSSNSNELLENDYSNENEANSNDIEIYVDNYQGNVSQTIHFVKRIYFLSRII